MGVIHEAITEIKIAGITAACAGENKVRCVCVDVQHHVACMEAENAFRLCGDVVEESVTLGARSFGGVRLFARDFLKGGENGIVDCAGVIEEETC